MSALRLIGHVVVHTVVHLALTIAIGAVLLLAYAGLQFLAEAF